MFWRGLSMLILTVLQYNVFTNTFIRHTYNLKHGRLVIFCHIFYLSSFCIKLTCMERNSLSHFDFSFEFHSRKKDWCMFIKSWKKCHMESYRSGSLMSANTLPSRTKNQADYISLLLVLHVSYTIWLSVCNSVKT